MTIYLYILSGLLGVTNMILWGLYGDLLVEEFQLRKVVRSLFFGILWSTLLYLVAPDIPLFIVALSVISLERITTEFYKALLRSEPQNKYKIPSDLNMKTKPGLKKLIGVLLIILTGVAVYIIEVPFDKIYIALAAGVLVALGGMLKDAPYEGFDKIKFLRSPLVAIVVGTAINALFPHIPGKYFILAVFGGERILSEFYKKIVRGRIPGKFRRANINPQWKAKRKNLLYLYALNLLLVLLLIWI